MADVENILRAGLDTTDFERGSRVVAQNLQDIGKKTDDTAAKVDKLDTTLSDSSKTAAELAAAINNLSSKIDQMGQKAQDGEKKTTTSQDRIREAVRRAREEAVKSTEQAQKNEEQDKKSSLSSRALAESSGVLRSSLMTLASTFGVALGAGAAFHKMLEEAGQSQVNSLRLNAMLKAQGEEAVTTAGHVERLASELQKLSGIDDDNITAAITTIARFGNMSEDTLDRVAKLSVNLSRASDSFGGVEGAARAVGRALKDPGEGMRQLAMAGYGVSDAVAASAKKLAEQGKVAEAQTIILAALEKKAGDVAAAYKETIPGALEAASTSVANFFEYAGKVPMFADGMVALGHTIEDAFSTEKSSAARVFGEVLGNTFGFIVQTVQKAVLVISFTLNKITDAAMAVGEALPLIWLEISTRMKIEFKAAYDYVVDLFSKLPEVIGNFGLTFGNKARTLYEYVKGGYSGVQEYQNSLTQGERDMLNGGSMTANIGADALAERQKSLDALNAEMAAHREWIASHRGINEELGKEDDQRKKLNGNPPDPAIADAYEKQRKELQAQVDAAVRLNAAYDKGVLAIAQVKQENDVLTQIRGLDAKYTAAQRTELERLIRAMASEQVALQNKQSILDSQAAIDRTKEELSLVNETAQTRDLELALYDKRLELQQRGIDLASEQASKELELVKVQQQANEDLKNAQEERDRWMESIKSGIGDIENGFKDAFTTIANGGQVKFSSFFDSVKKMAINTAAMIAQQMVFRPIISSIVTSISPTVASATGYTTASGSSASGGSGGLSSVSNILGLGKNLLGGSFTSGITSGINSFGASIGFGGVSPSFVGPLLPGTGVGSAAGALTSASLTSVLGAAGIGFGIGNLLQGFGASKAVSGIGGAASGALAGFMMGGPVGAIVGGIGGLLGGIIGNKKPTNAAAFGNVDFDAGTATYSNMNKGNSAENQKLLAQAFDGVLSFGKAFNTIGVGTISGKISGIDAGVRDRQSAYVNGVKVTADAGQFGQLAINSLKEMMKQTTITNSDVRTALGKVDYSDLNKAITDINFAANFQESLKAYREGLSEENDIRKEAKSNVSSLLTTMSDFLDSTERLGLSVPNATSAIKAYVDNLVAGVDTTKTLSTVEKSVIALKAQWEAMGPVLEKAGYTTAQAAELIKKGYTNNLAKLTENFNQSVQEQIQQMTDPTGYALAQLQKEYDALRKDAIAVGGDLVAIEQLYGLKRAQILQQTSQAALDALQNQAKTVQDWLNKQLLGSTSTLNPQQQFTEAQSQFSSALTSARNDSNVDISTVTAAGDTLLAIAKSYLASSPQYSAIVDMVRSSIKSLAGSRGLPGFATGTLSAPSGFAMVGESGPELVELAGGERIHTASETMSMMTGGSRPVVSELRALREQQASESAALRREVANLRNENAQMRRDLSRVISTQPTNGRRSGAV